MSKMGSMTATANNHYQCDQCGGVFEQGWTDDEAQAEASANGWSQIPAIEMAVVCDDCYKEIMNWAKQSSSLARN